MYYRVFWINQASETFFSNSDKIAFLENLPYRFRNFTSKDSSFTFTWIYIYIYSIINCIKILRKFFKIVILVSKVSILSVFHFSKHTRGKVIVNRDTKFLFGTDSDVGPLHFLRLVSVQVRFRIPRRAGGGQNCASRIAKFQRVTSGSHSRKHSRIRSTLHRWSRN